MGTRALAAVASAGLASTLMACGAGSQATVPLHVAGDPSSANVTVDDQPVGSLKMVMEHGVALPPGEHRVSVEAPGYFPLDRVVTAPPGSTDPVKLDVHLEKIPE